MDGPPVASVRVRSISLAVDVTNYVMLETGPAPARVRPAALARPFGVRRARRGGETDHPRRRRSHARPGRPRRHRRFRPDRPRRRDGWRLDRDRGRHHGRRPRGRALGPRLDRPDRAPAQVAERGRSPFRTRCRPRYRRRRPARAASSCSSRTAAPRPAPGFTVVGTPVEPPTIALDVRRAERTAGLPIPREDVVAPLGARRLPCRGRRRAAGATAVVASRPHLAGRSRRGGRAAVGYENAAVGAARPRRPARGLTRGSGLLRTSRARSRSGLVEVLSYPFVAPDVYDAFGLAADDPRRRTVRLVNPLSEDHPELRTFLLPGSSTPPCATSGAATVIWRSSRPAWSSSLEPRAATSRVPGVEARPSADQLAALDAAVAGPTAPPRRPALRRPRTARLVGGGRPADLGRCGRGRAGRRRGGARRAATPAGADARRGIPAAARR